MNAKKYHENNFQEWANTIRSGSRRELARAITLTESSRLSDIYDAQQLLELLLPASGKSVRIGISGVPGAGKSTFIESLGLELLQEKHKVAVLTIDPSSPKSGGSILGDKTRMTEFARSENAFIRPSPAGLTPGGVTRKTRESILLCEAAGFDVVLVETTGVGQSEWKAAEMVDFFIVLMLPNAGDSLQGMKKGILEMADAILVNKSDCGHEEVARQAAQIYKDAIASAGREDYALIVRDCSGLNRLSVRECWQQISERIEMRKNSGFFRTRREEQLRSWVRSLAVDSIIQTVQDAVVGNNTFEIMISEVLDGKLTPLQAGLTFRKLLLSKLSDESGQFDVPI